jgi:hypothetical protein
MAHRPYSLVFAHSDARDRPLGDGVAAKSIPEDKELDLMPSRKKSASKSHPELPPLHRQPIAPPNVYPK